MSTVPPDDDLAEEEVLLRWVGRKAIVWWAMFLSSAGASILLDQVGAKVLIIALAPLVGWSMLSSVFWTRQFKDMNQKLHPATTEEPKLTKSCLRKRDS